MKLTGHTRLICLLGSPVAHSISPAMHNTAFEALDLDYAYMAYNIGEEQLEEAVSALKLFNARGWNLTMPCKTRMCELVDVLTPAARITGAVNTVINDDGVLTGHTTDGSGYMQMLSEEGILLKGKKMVIAGAGGAARSIAVQGALDGAKEVVIFNRSIEKAQGIADDINRYTNAKSAAYNLRDTAQLQKALEDAALFTNATNVGMAPDTEACILPDVSVLHEGLAVSDIIYNPRQTALLQRAKARGCQTVNGLGMLLWQGAHAFKLWTGQEMPVDLVKEACFRNR